MNKENEISAKVERGSVSRSMSLCKSSRCGSQTRAPQTIHAGNHNYKEASHE